MAIDGIELGNLMLIWPSCDSLNTNRFVSNQSANQTKLKGDGLELYNPGDYLLGFSYNEGIPIRDLIPNSIETDNPPENSPIWIELSSNLVLLHWEMPN